MRKIFNYLVLVPIGILLILISVANRQWVRFSVDPINSETPLLSFELPFFVFLFLMLFAGMILGSMLTWVKQGKHRKALREKSSEADRLRFEKEMASNANAQDVQEIAPGLPLISKA